jgi:hypothetical protein
MSRFSAPRGVWATLQVSLQLKLKAFLVGPWKNFGVQ